MKEQLREEVLLEVDLFADIFTTEKKLSTHGTIYLLSSPMYDAINKTTKHIHNKRNNVSYDKL
jgi:hypothetical protein